MDSSWFLMVQICRDSAPNGFLMVQIQSFRTLEMSSKWFKSARIALLMVSSWFLMVQSAGMVPFETANGTIPADWTIRSAILADLGYYELILISSWFPNLRRNFWKFSKIHVLFSSWLTIRKPLGTHGFEQSPKSSGVGTILTHLRISHPCLDSSSSLPFVTMIT